MCNNKHQRGKKMMKKTKTKTIAIAFCLIFAIGSSLILLPNAAAHDPAWEIPTFAFINVSPNPVGLGQQAAVVVWLDKIPDGALITNNIRFHNYRCEITAPDGTTQTITWETVTDTTSSAYSPFTPNQVGTYTFNFSFPGQKYTDYTHNQLCICK
jgi:hypothetical protein